MKKTKFQFANSRTALCRSKQPHWNLKNNEKGSPYSIAERGVPELIPVLGSQPAGNVSHKPGGRLT